MKFNEPVRPAGIGRKQVAFDVGRKPTALTIAENEEATQLDPQSNEAQNIATLAQAGAHARAIAYSAASSAMSNNQNEIWGVRGVADFNIENNASFGYVKWTYSGTIYKYEIAQINNPFMYIDTEDPAKIRVNRPGWYLVDAMVIVENYKNSTDYSMDIVLDDTEIIVVGFDKVHTNQYPTLRINAIIPVPAVESVNYPDFTRYFRIRWHANSIAPNTTIQADGFIHAIWLKPWEIDEIHPTN